MMQTAKAINKGIRGGHRGFEVRVLFPDRRMALRWYEHQNGVNDVDDCVVDCCIRAVGRMAGVGCIDRACNRLCVATASNKEAESHYRAKTAQKTLVAAHTMPPFS